jgi:hypothetical protein
MICFTIANPNPEPPSDREPLLFTHKNAQKPIMFFYSSIITNGISTFSFVKLTTATLSFTTIFPILLN